MTRLGLAQQLHAEAAGLESQARAFVERARLLREAAEALSMPSGKEGTPCLDEAHGSDGS